VRNKPFWRGSGVQTGIESEEAQALRADGLNPDDPAISAPIHLVQWEPSLGTSIIPHDLRHTAASPAVSAGANVKAVQRMLGHAKASMTLDVYAELFDADLDDVATNLDAAIRSAAYPLRIGDGTAQA
jgi:integrase